MKSEPLGILVIGTGGIGTYHLRNWQQVPGAQVVAVHDLNTQVAQRAAAEYAVPRVHCALDEALDDPRVTAVDVCTPNMLHKQAVLAALNAGKHCLCEKPLAATAADIREMIAARDHSGRLLMTAQHIRFEQCTQTLRRFIAAGRLGDVYYARAWWLRRRLAPTSPGLLSRAQAGYGPGLDLGVHMVDLVLHLLDHPEPVSASAVSSHRLALRPDSSVVNQWGAYDPRHFDVEDFVGGFVRFANGAALSLEVSWLLNMVEPEVQQLWLYGTEGGVQWPDLKLAHVDSGVLVDTQAVSGLQADGCRNELIAFVDAIRQAQPSPVPAEQSLTVARVLEALYQSAATGHEVRLQG